MAGPVATGDIVVTPQHAMSDRTDPDFALRVPLWAEAAATRGQQLLADGVDHGMAAARSGNGVLGLGP